MKLKKIIKDLKNKIVKKTYKLDKPVWTSEIHSDDYILYLFFIVNVLIIVFFIGEFIL